MLSQPKKLATTALLLSTLSACGGGSTSAVPFTSMSERPEDGAVALQGKAHTASYNRNSLTGTIDAGFSSDVKDSTLTATFEDGTHVATQASAGDSSFDIDTREDGQVTVSQHLASMASRSDSSLAFFSNPDTAGLDYMSYGAWVDVDSPYSGSIVAGTYGTVTQEADMPSSGSATFRGNGVGVADLNDGSLYATEFDVSVYTSDFNRVSISSSNTITTELTAYSGSRYNTSLDFSGSGTIDGSEIKANLTSSFGNGTATGSFYGPNAEEIGATFGIDGSNGTHVGSFGASR